MIGSLDTSKPRRALGITAGLDAGLARHLATRCEHLGYHSLWSNDEPTSPGLRTLAHFAAAAPQLELGVGVLPLDRNQPAQIAAEIDHLGLDPAKLWLGVGSGSLRSQIDVVRRSVAELRQLLPEEIRIVVAAMRRRLCWWVARLPMASCSTGCCPPKLRERVSGASSSCKPLAL